MSRIFPIHLPKEYHVGDRVIRLLRPWAGTSDVPHYLKGDEFEVVEVCYDLMGYLMGMFLKPVKVAKPPAYPGKIYLSVFMEDLDWEFA